MELPHIGINCATKTCNRLDFLPVKCDACHGLFCIEHYRYETHNCVKSKLKDVQVPACPICSQPVGCKKGELPDVAVSNHIDQYCSQNDLLRNKQKKPVSNLKACSFKSCKQKDLIYLECSDCKSKFCIRHRHPSDHSCSGPSKLSYLSDNWQSLKEKYSQKAPSSIDMIRHKARQISRSGQAALSRMANSKMAPSTSNQPAAANRATARNRGASLQGNLTEDEALAIALKESAVQGTEMDEDLALAKAIRQSEIEARNNQAMANKDTCVLS